MVRFSPGVPPPAVVEGALIQEIKQQLAQRGDGTIWIENWKAKYGSLNTTVKGFLESRSDLFALTYNGNKYTVALVGGGKKGGKSKGKLQQQGGKGKPKAAMAALASTSYSSQWTALVATGGDEDDLIAEIMQQLTQRDDGKVWIDGWRNRYAHLAETPREYMEGRPDLFALTCNGNKYTVALVGGGKKGGKGKGKLQQQGGKGKPKAAMAALASTSYSSQWTAPVATGGDEDDLIAEIMQQLTQREDGKVWITGWKSRYGHLAETPREYMEGRPDLFELTYDETNANKFTVAMADGAVAKNSGGKKRQHSSGGGGGGKAPPAKVAKTQGTVVEAVAEASSL